MADPAFATAILSSILNGSLSMRKFSGWEAASSEFGGEKNNRRIITRQDLVKGKPAWWPDITKMMVNDLGFLNGNFGIGYVDSYAYVREDVAVFDMRPANVFETADGILIAVDSIPLRITDANRFVFQ